MSAVALAAVTVASAVVSAALLVFGLRRIVFAVAALWRPRPVLPIERIPSILVLLAARNEGPVVGRALRSLGQIRYPADNIEITLIDDGSTDETSTILAQWAHGRPRTRVTTVSRLAGAVSGKAAALTTGLAASPRTDLVAIVDADFEVEPAGLALLAAAFSDPCIGAVSGYLRPRNADGGVVARYAALETWLHQLVTSAAKDRLRLDPPTIGLWVVRHDVLDAIGGFPDTVTGEDMRVPLPLQAPSVPVSCRGGRVKHRRREPGRVLVAASTLGARGVCSRVTAGRKAQQLKRHAAE
jgi:cellulose synthase/poly-beta-1,6-N-acetylglucosamine synthase-like glycosyltransferase